MINIAFLHTKNKTKICITRFADGTDFGLDGLDTYGFG
jgi:hypothetical protein